MDSAVIVETLPILGVCNLCVSEGVVQSMVTKQDNSDSYTDMLLKCFSIDVSTLDLEETKRLICEACASKLQAAAAFKEKVETSLKLLQAILKLRRSGGNPPDVKEKSSSEINGHFEDGSIHEDDESDEYGRIFKKVKRELSLSSDNESGIDRGKYRPKRARRKTVSNSCSVKIVHDSRDTVTAVDSDLFPFKIDVNVSDDNQSMIQEYAEGDSGIVDSGGHTNNENSASVSGNYDGDYNRFNVINVKLNQCLQILGSLARPSIRSGENYLHFNSENALQMKKDLPLKSRAEVDAFEERLLNSQEYRQEFARTVNQIGGANGKDYTERVLNTIFSPAFAADNTWEGKKTKYKINKLNLINICEEMILKKFTTWDSAEFSKVGTNWFRLGNQRAGQQPKQVKKKMNSSINGSIEHSELNGFQKTNITEAFASCHKNQYIDISNIE